MTHTTQGSPTGSRRVQLRSELRVELPAAEALGLFTPVGERSWVDGWNPVFPAGEVGDGAAVGTVFITDHGGRRTTWTVVDRDEARVRYARTTPDWWAGVVEVRCLDEGDGAARVVVTYDLTALSEDAVDALLEFQAGYPEYIAGWGRDIRAALGGSSSGHRGRGPTDDGAHDSAG